MADEHDDDDRLAQIKREAALAFGFDESFAERLRGGNRGQLYDDARALHEQTTRASSRGWPTLAAAVHVLRRDREAQARRLFGTRA